jgi:divalent metal cation (Fe/Co/Zn/Cd) transporter
MFHGFALNSLNPSVWLYWLALAAVVKAEIHLTDVQTFAFFISMLLAELAGGILKSRLASLLKNNLTERAMRGVSLFAGMILIALGGYIIGSMVMRLRNPERVDKEPAEMVTQIINRSLNSSPRDTNVTDTSNETFYFNQ